MAVVRVEAAKIMLNMRIGYYVIHTYLDDRNRAQLNDFSDYSGNKHTMTEK